MRTCEALAACWFTGESSAGAPAIAEPRLFCFFSFSFRPSPFRLAMGYLALRDQCWGSAGRRAWPTPALLPLKKQPGAGLGRVGGGGVRPAPHFRQIHTRPLRPVASEGFWAVRR